ncbi:hypothetical protein [Peribacillus frigoritolerans]|uniref:hypothetical protein n=1 Tax=Peribacillus frigoritolerans TaxID=450367 RepID=UPI00315DB050
MNDIKKKGNSRTFKGSLQTIGKLALRNQLLFLGLIQATSKQAPVESRLASYSAGVSQIFFN